MPQERHTVDQIVAKLRKADVELGKGKKVPEVCKLREIFEQTYSRKTTFSFSKKKLFTKFWKQATERSGTIKNLIGVPRVPTIRCDAESHSRYCL